MLSGLYYLHLNFKQNLQLHIFEKRTKKRNRPGSCSPFFEKSIKHNMGFHFWRNENVCPALYCLIPILYHGFFVCQEIFAKIEERREASAENSERTYPKDVCG